MLPVSTTSPVRFTPPAYEGKENAPVYLIKIPTHRDKIEFHGEVTLSGLRYPSTSEIGAALSSGLADLGDDFKPLQEVVDRFSNGIELSSDEQFKLGTLADALRNVGYLPLLSLLALREKYGSASAFIAAQMFLVGWENVLVENVSVEFERKLNRVPEPLLEKISLNDVIRIGNKARMLMTPTAEEEKK